MMTCPFQLHFGEALALDHCFESAGLELLYWYCRTLYCVSVSSARNERNRHRSTHR